MENKINRRKAVMLLGGMAGAGAAANLIARADEVIQPAPKSVLNKIPWPYKPLDPEVAAQRGFDGFYKAECCFGVFDPVAGGVADQLGSPYTEFPFLMFKYGGGGVKGWATLCGTLNGAAAAIQLVSPDPDPVVNALFEWYEHTELPNVRPRGAKFAEFRSTANSPMCHQSIASWIKVSHKHAYCPERSERCACLAASVAKQTALLLNAQAAGKPVAFSLPKETQGCMSCHEKGSVLENARTKMDCGGCHAPLIGKHPSKT